MIGCEEKVDSFDPNYYCHSKRRFLSILSLGNDVYFQDTGRFWRYNRHGFEMPFPNKTSHFMVPLRLDSDMVEVLENIEFGGSLQKRSFYICLI